MPPPRWQVNWCWWRRQQWWWCRFCPVKAGLADYRWLQVGNYTALTQRHCTGVACHFEALLSTWRHCNTHSELHLAQLHCITLQWNTPYDQHKYPKLLRSTLALCMSKESRASNAGHSLTQLWSCCRREHKNLRGQSQTATTHPVCSFENWMKSICHIRQS